MTLSGKRILVTRSVEQAGELAALADAAHELREREIQLLTAGK